MIFAVASNWHGDVSLIEFKRLQKEIEWLCRTKSDLLLDKLMLPEVAEGKFLSR